MHISTVDLSARLIFALCSMGLSAVILSMIRRNVIKEKYALLWLPLGAGFLILSLFPELLVRFSERVKLHYITVVVLAVILVFTTILLYFTARLSQLREDVKTLAQEVALSRSREASAARPPVPAPPEAASRPPEIGWSPAPAGDAAPGEIKDPGRKASR